MNEMIKALKHMIDESNYIVFFGGAGVSTESGIPDFRSVDGLYSQKYKYPPETILSASFFKKNPEEFYKFIREKLVVTGVDPNKAHIKLAELEKEGKLKAIVTQNVDGLHQAAGSKNVLELHGTMTRFYCTKCQKDMPTEDARTLIRQNEGDGIPRCTACGGIVRPDVVLFEEGLNMAIMSDAVRHISQCDMLIIGGTSLNVYPAAGFVNYYNRVNKKLVLINRDPTSFDNNANLVIHGKIGEILSQV